MATKKIYASNVEALRAAISEAEGKATARTLDAESVQDRLEQVVRDYLNDMPKKYLAGCKAIVHASTEKLPNAYKFQADSTKAVLEHDGKGWVLVRVERSRLVTRSVFHGVQLELTDDAKAWLINSVAFV